MNRPPKPRCKQCDNIQMACNCVEGFEPMGFDEGREAMLTEEESDPINPDHYNGTTVMEFIEVMKLGYKLGNSIKYISRAGEKDPAKYVEDLQKAIWHIQREIDLHD